MSTGAAHAAPRWVPVLAEARPPRGGSGSAWDPAAPATRHGRPRGQAGRLVSKAPAMSEAAPPSSSRSRRRASPRSCPRPRFATSPIRRARCGRWPVCCDRGAGSWWRTSWWVARTSTGAGGSACGTPGEQRAGAAHCRRCPRPRSSSPRWSGARPRSAATRSSRRSSPRSLVWWTGLRLDKELEAEWRGSRDSTGERSRLPAQDVAGRATASAASPGAPPAAGSTSRESPACSTVS